MKHSEVMRTFRSAPLRSCKTYLEYVLQYECRAGEWQGRALVYLLVTITTSNRHSSRRKWAQTSSTHPSRTS